MIDVVGYEYRWATTGRAHSMPHVDELAYLGYEPMLRDGEVVDDPRYGSVLMRRPCA